MTDDMELEAEEVEEVDDLDEETELEATADEEEPDDEEIRRPDVEAELGKLKDFQRRTAELVFQRLYLDESPRHRFLVADEVGLGKTHVARGVIAQAIDHLWDRVERVDIIYLCSNAAIARQNVGKLLPAGAGACRSANRITLLPRTARNLADHKVNVFALTPGTSLNLKGAMGVMGERVLLLQMLKEHWGLNRRGADRLFAGSAGVKKFSGMVRRRGAEVGTEAEVPPKFLAAVDEACRNSADRGIPTLRDRVTELTEWFASHRRKPPKDIASQRRAVIGELRGILATTCIDMLEPDLIIVDEFQRFREVLDGTGPAGEMAKQLFDYETGHHRARVLLLSATPYKMYTVREEGSGEDHYQDFLRTAAFLLDDEVRLATLSTALEDYRRQLLRLGQGAGADGLEQSRAVIEETLRRVMVRTERLAVTKDRSGMLVERGPSGVGLEARDARAYREIQAVARKLEHHDTMEYWKAAPWLLSFMEGYQLRTDFDVARKLPARSAEIAQAVQANKDVLLDAGEVAALKPLDPAHGRLRWLIEHTLGAELWKLLWMPPTLPYYLGEGPYREAALRSPTKTLLFSAWRVVPRAVAAILSHEAERRCYELFLGAGEDLSKSRERFSQTLRLQRQDGRLTGMPVLALMYPCAWMARECDPKELATTGENGPLSSLDDLLKRTKEKLAPVVLELTAGAAQGGPVDESWYWALPILLDRRDDREALEVFFEYTTAEHWIGDSKKGKSAKLDSAIGENDWESDGDTSTEQMSWVDHVKSARKLALEGGAPAGRPPDDLLDVLALLALGGPGTISLRAFSRVCGRSYCVDDWAREYAAQVAWRFRALYNQPDSTALIRASTREESPYWRQCLEYGAMGGLQAVMDEYVHLLSGQVGATGKEPHRVLAEIVPELMEALTLQRGGVGAHHYQVQESGKIQQSTSRLRARFAVRFGEERADESGDAVRADSVRKAFNSPFAPFVLATTSVGQEGLDFHPYCHAVVHWNLPGNPVDMEQREGRIHRFKGHAVRKNVAKRHGAAAFKGSDGDPWDAVFQAAAEAREEGENELIPYWVYPDPEGAAIERYVPAYTLSRDTERLAALRRSLAIYRMVFGQPRQEELLAYLARTLTAEELAQYDERLRVSLAP